MFLERLIQHVRPGKWADLEEINKRYNAVESRYGFPQKKRYQALFGEHTSDVLIIEREWESLAKMEEVYMSAMSDPESEKLKCEIVEILEDSRNEIYSVLP